MAEIAQKLCISKAACISSLVELSIGSGALSIVKKARDLALIPFIKWGIERIDVYGIDSKKFPKLSSSRSEQLNVIDSDK